MEAAEPIVDVQAAAAKQSLFGDNKKKSKPVWALLEEAAQMKTEGNAFYREKNIRSAIGRYHRALLVLRSLDADVNTSVKGFGPETPELTSEQEATLRNIQVDCYNNLAGTTYKYCLGTWQGREGKRREGKRALVFRKIFLSLLYGFFQLVPCQKLVYQSRNQVNVSCKDMPFYFILRKCFSYPTASLLQKQNVDYTRVQEYSLRVLKWRPNDVKALYRAGVATLEMGDAQTARHYLAKACNEQPNGKRVTTASVSPNTFFA